MWMIVRPVQTGSKLLNAPIIDDMTMEPKRFTTKQEALAYAELSKIRLADAVCWEKTNGY